MNSHCTVAYHEPGGHETWWWPNYGVVDPANWPWSFFTPKEMACRATGQLMVSPLFMDDIQLVRDKTGVAMPVTSGYRTPDHNKAVSSTDSLEGPHPDAQAIDVHVIFEGAYEIVSAATAQRFAGIGLRQHGETKGRFLHLDTWYKRVRPTLWTYDKKG